MFGSVILEVAIGLSFVYLIASLICSALREGVETWFKTRAALLHQGINQLLHGDESLVRDLYNHPLIYALFDKGYEKPDPDARVTQRAWWQRTNLPTYIPAANFASALLDLTVRGRDTQAVTAAAADTPPITISNIRASVGNLDKPEVQRAILSAIDVAQGDLDGARAAIEEWFNSAMDRVGGWYKRRTQVYLFLFGFLVAVAANINTFQVAQYLYRQPGAREALVASASAAARDTAYHGAPLDTLLGRLEALNLPIGWSNGLSGGRHAKTAAASSAGGKSTGPELWSWIRQNGGDLVWALLGWLTTALAISLGAPFWFDLLNRFVRIRSTVKPQKAPGEGGPVTAAPQVVVTGSAATASPDLADLASQLPNQPAVQP